jgi:hypothetical protein
MSTGRDPSVQKKLDRLAKQASDAVTFETVAREWFALYCPGSAPLRQIWFN